jgi:hypothetical protein
MSTVTVQCRDGVYAAELLVPANFNAKCIGIVVRLADGSVKRATAQVA